jgi:prepilin-type processing-associated H-X9-DG protein
MLKSKHLSNVEESRVKKVKLFTLLELLIVIGVIAILSSLLLPALNKAKKQAFTMQCASNLKSIGTAMHCYQSDFDGYTPVWLDSQSTWMDGNWVYRLAQYMSGNVLCWVCPDSPEGRAIDVESIKQKALLSQKVVAIVLQQNIAINGRCFGMTPPKASILKRPSRLIYGGDGTGANASWYTPCNTNDFRYAIDRVYPDHPSSFYIRHYRNINLLFVDGHVGKHNGNEVKRWCITPGDQFYNQ